MIPVVEWSGRKWQNYGNTLDRGFYVEDWIKGERVFCPSGDGPSVNVHRDPRLWNWQYSCDLHPAYIAIGADKWTLPDLDELGWVNPPAPLA